MAIGDPIVEAGGLPDAFFICSQSLWISLGIAFGDRSQASVSQALLLFWAAPDQLTLDRIKSMGYQ